MKILILVLTLIKLILLKKLKKINLVKFLIIIELEYNNFINYNKKL